MPEIKNIEIPYNKNEENQRISDDIIDNRSLSNNFNFVNLNILAPKALNYKTRILSTPIALLNNIKDLKKMISSIKMETTNILPITLLKDSLNLNQG